MFPTSIGSPDGQLARSPTIESSSFRGPANVARVPGRKRKNLERGTYSRARGGCPQDFENLRATHAPLAPHRRYGVAVKLVALTRKGLKEREFRWRTRHDSNV